MSETMLLRPDARVQADQTPHKPTLSRYWSLRFWNTFSWYTMMFKNLHWIDNPWLERSMQRSKQGMIDDLKAKGANYRNNWFPVPSYQVDDLADPKIRQLVNRAEPFVLRGAAKHWQAVKEWNLDFFSERFGDQTMTAKNDLMDSGVFEKRRIRDVVNDLKAGKPIYSGFAEEIILRNPELLEHINRRDILTMMGKKEDRKSSLVNFFRNGTISSIQLFIQGAQSHTTYHMTKFHNFFVELQGKKEWVLVDPRYSVGVDIKPSQAYYFITPQDVDSPDSADDLYSYIPKLHVIIEPGDILFIPSYWWHDVRTYHSDHVIGMAIRASDWVLEKWLFDFLLLFDKKTISFFYKAFIKGQPLTDAENAVEHIDADLKRLGVADSGDGKKR